MTEQIASQIIFLNVTNKMDLIAQQVTGFAWLKAPTAYRSTVKHATTI
jgi:hypothetical protein